MGYSLKKYLAEVSHREHLLQLAWLDQEWNRPSKADFYLMQIACEVRRVLSKKPRSIKLKDFLLKFGENSKGETRPKLTREQATAKSASAWLAALGGKVAYKKGPATPAEGQS